MHSNGYSISHSRMRWYRFLQMNNRGLQIRTEVDAHSATLTNQSVTSLIFSSVGSRPSMCSTKSLAIR